MLHKMVFRDYPVVTAKVDAARIEDAAYRNERAEAAQFTVNWASARRPPELACGYPLPEPPKTPAAD